jgi:antitoxin Phd
MRTMTSVEAQNRFGELIDAAQREPVTITRRGRPVAFMVSSQDMEELMEVRKQRSNAVAAFESFFAKSDKKLTPEAEAISVEAVKQIVDELR